MDAQKGNIYEILNGNKQFIIPVYQRFYSWDVEQCKRLWMDIVQMQKQSKAGHFVGSIVNIAESAMPTGVQKFMIIDGQQRMTTLTLLFIALRNYARDHGEDTINPNRIDGMLLKNEYESGDERYKLLLTETDRDLLIRLVEDKPIEANTHSRLLDNYSFFLDAIGRKEIELDEVWNAVGKLQIVNITLDRETDDAQAIFESLNSTGKELSESDLIRNYILMDLPPDEQIYIYEHLWRPMEDLFVYETRSDGMDGFFRCYLTMKNGAIPKKNRVYEVFKSFVEKSFTGAVGDLCEDLLTYARYYTAIIYLRSDDKQLKRLYGEIKDLRMEVSFPFLLKVHGDRDKGLLTDEELKAILTLCISYVLRRNICDIPTNSMNKTFATMKNFVREEDYLNSVKAFFLLQETYKAFPDDDAFGAAFVSRDIYNMRVRSYILSRLENEGKKAPVQIENYTIEHIMPQNKHLSTAWQKDLGDDWQAIQRKYLHTIGNLTLTAYNSEMSDRAFSEKVDMAGGFKESALRLNKDIVALDSWNEEEIIRRARGLCALAKTIWPYPALSEEERLRYEEDGEPTRAYTLDHYDMSDYAKILFDALNRRIMNLSPEVRREFNKYYISYKLDTNFVDVVVHKKNLRLVVNMKFFDVIDPDGICRDITNLGRWGNGDVDLMLRSIDELDSVMAIVEQSFNARAEG